LCPEEDDDCFFYWVVVCWGCKCWSYSVPSEGCPEDDFHSGDKPKYVGPKYYGCHQEDFKDPDSDSGWGPDYYDDQWTPKRNRSNDAREQPWKNGPPGVFVENIE
jgi:hypothetical protein